MPHSVQNDKEVGNVFEGKRATTRERKGEREKVKSESEVVEREREQEGR